MTIIKRLHVSFIEHEDVLILLFKFITSLKDKIMKKTIKKVSKTFFASFFVFQFVMVSALMPISAIGAEEIVANFSKDSSNVERSEVSAKTASSEESVSFDTKIGLAESEESTTSKDTQEDVSSGASAGNQNIEVDLGVEADAVLQVIATEALNSFSGNGEKFGSFKVCNTVFDQDGNEIFVPFGESFKINISGNGISKDLTFDASSENCQTVPLAYHTEGVTEYFYSKMVNSSVNNEWEVTYLESLTDVAPSINNSSPYKSEVKISDDVSAINNESDGCFWFAGNINANDYTFYEYDGGENCATEDSITADGIEPTKRLYVYNKAKGPITQPAKIIATKIVCESENMLPNWGGIGGNPITVDANTANNFLAQNSGCEIDEDWEFQYASAMGAGTPNPGNNLTDGGQGWTTFVGSQGVFVAADQGEETNMYSYWVREVMQDGYIPFSGTVNTNNDEDFDGHEDVSAEIYCQFFDQTYGQNYDNYDQVLYLEAGQTYYCVAFNAPVDEPVDYTDPTDPETCPAIVRFSEDGRNGMVKVSKKHPNWKNISGAEWVWDKDPLPVFPDRQKGGVFEVIEVVNISGNPQDSSISIAADNIYSVVVNGNTLLDVGTFGDPNIIPSDIVNITSAQSKFSQVYTHVIPAEFLNTGSNTIVIRAVNQEWPNPDITEANIHINPAGLIFSLEINHDCAEIEVELCQVGAAILVYPNGKKVYSENLPAGTYIVKAEGTYFYRNLNGQGVQFLEADALFSHRALGDDGYNEENPWRIAGDAGHLGIKVNGALPTATWGTEYNPEHVYYSDEVVLNEDGTINFQITDNVYGDNSGYLTVTILGDCDDTDSTDSTDPGCTENCGGGGSSSGGGSGGGSSSGGGSVLGANDGEILGATSCVAFTTYNRLGNQGGEIKALQTFLNEYMNAGLVVDGIYGHATTQAVHDFQAYHWKEVIDPWTPPLSPNTTGWQYKSTRATINTIIECPEAPVFLEDPMINYSVPTVEDKKPFTAEQIQKIYDLLIEAGSASSVAL